MHVERIPVTGLDGGRVRLTGQQLEALSAKIDGSLARPGDEAWNESVRIWNGMVKKTPALVLRPVCADDVSTAVRFARDHRLLLSIKGGGHNIGGTSIADGGLMLDMARMSDVVVDPAARLVSVGPGCRLRDVDGATQAHGLATVLGFVSDTGVAGLTLGGGLGYLTRRFGWSVDNVTEFEVVTADGEVRVANGHVNADLFWALRGGGGNFGVVTRFTFRLHEVGPDAYGGLIAWPFARAAEVLDAYRRITAEAPRELAVWMVLLRAPEAPFVPDEWRGERICAMAVCYTGGMDAVDHALAPIRALGDPIVDLLGVRPYAELQSYLDATEPVGAHYYWKTEYLASLSDDLLTILREAFASCPMPHADVGLLHLGGALNEHAEDDGAVGNRDAQYVVGIKGMWEPAEANAVRFRQWVRDVWAALRPCSTGRTYVNFQTADEEPERIRASYGVNYDRLVRVKRRYDPDNLFRVNRNIGETR